MKNFELSQKVNLTTGAGIHEIKHALMTILGRSFAIDTVQESPQGFHFRGTTGGKRSWVRHAQAHADINIIYENTCARILVHGYSTVPVSMMVGYCILFVLVLFAGLLPGSINTGDDGTAMDALCFLIFGIFIFFDIDKKLDEPQAYLRATLDSVNVEFG